MVCHCVATIIHLPILTVVPVPIPIRAPGAPRGATLLRLLRLWPLPLVEAILCARAPSLLLAPRPRAPLLLRCRLLVVVLLLRVSHLEQLLKHVCLLLLLCLWSWLCLQLWPVPVLRSLLQGQLLQARQQLRLQARLRLQPERRPLLLHWQPALALQHRRVSLQLPAQKRILGAQLFDDLCIAHDLHVQR